MERREKTEFILEQMRLLIAVARLKDAESGKDGKDAMGGGEAEWVKVRVGSRKVNEEFLKEKENEVRSRFTEVVLPMLIFFAQDLKLKYYDMMVQHGLRHAAYLDVAKYYYKVWETPSIKEDVNGKGRIVRCPFPDTLVQVLTLRFFQALEHIVYFVVLAPHDNEQSDMMHRLFLDPALTKLELH